MTTPGIDITPLVQAFLPRSLYPKAKAVVAAVLTVLNFAGTLIPLLAGAPTWIPVAVAGAVTALTPVLVYLTDNQTGHTAGHQPAAIAQDGTAIPHAQD